MSKRPIMDFFSKNHMCHPDLEAAHVAAETGSELAKICDAIKTSNMAAFESVLLSWVRGVFMGRASQGTEQTAETELMNVLQQSTICDECMTHWVGKHCCAMHAMRELIEEISKNTDDFNVKEVPLTEADQKLPFDPSLN